jgi:hypothetical protein
VAAPEALIATVRVLEAPATAGVVVGTGAMMLTEYEGVSPAQEADPDNPEDPIGIVRAPPPGSTRVMLLGTGAAHQPLINRSIAAIPLELDTSTMPCGEAPCASGDIAIAALLEPLNDTDGSAGRAHVAGEFVEMVPV